MCNLRASPKEVHMTSEKSSNGSWLSRLKEHLNKGRYSAYTVIRRTAVANHFLEYLSKRNIAVEAVEPSHIDRYLLNELRLYRQRHQCSPESISRWRYSHTAGIYMLVRLVRRQWPPL